MPARLGKHRSRHKAGKINYSQMQQECKDSGYGRRKSIVIGRRVV